MPKFLETLPEELRSDPALQVFKDAEDGTAVAKAFVETKKMVGRYANSVIIPAEGTNEDAPEMVEFLTKLGRPKESKDYEVPANLLILPNGKKVPQEWIEEFRSQAHALGMTKKQFQKAFGMRIEKTLKDNEAANKVAVENRQQTETALRQKFGAKYSERIQGIQKLISAYGEGVTQEDIDDALKRPGMVSLLSNILDNLSEASLEGMGHSKGVELTPDEAKDEIQRIRTDKDHPLNAAFNNPNAGEKHKEAKARVDKLYEWGYPGKKKL